MSFIYTVADQQVGGGGGKLLMRIGGLKRQHRRPNGIELVDVVMMMKDIVIVHGGVLEMRRGVWEVMGLHGGG